MWAFHRDTGIPVFLPLAKGIIIPYYIVISLISPWCPYTSLYLFFRSFDDIIAHLVLSETQYITNLCCALCRLSWLCDLDISSQSLFLQISFPASAAEPLLSDSLGPLILGSLFSAGPYGWPSLVSGETEHYFVRILGYEAWPAVEELPLTHFCTCPEVELDHCVRSPTEMQWMNGAQHVSSHTIYTQG